ncbi:MAG TPA: hypothetical protein PLS00_13435, partial [Niabella sp.]|nr:hypothetical protein [Niabella sp.]
VPVLKRVAVLFFTAFEPGFGLFAFAAGLFHKATLKWRMVERSTRGNRLSFLTAKALAAVVQLWYPIPVLVKTTAGT